MIGAREWEAGLEMPVWLPGQRGARQREARVGRSGLEAGTDMAQIVRDIRAELAKYPLQEGHFTQLKGQFQAQEEASRLITGLSLASLAMIFLSCTAATSRPCCR